jgi:plasmid stabilization system protein ParE
VTSGTPWCGSSCGVITRSPALNLAWLAALEAIEAMPRRFSPVEDAPEGYEVRECYIARFKYRVIFYISGNDIRVIALIHARQHDRLWMSRLTAE